METKAWGGARKGAGRPKVDVRRLSRVQLLLTEDEHGWLVAYAEELGVKPPEALRRMIAEKRARRGP